MLITIYYLNTILTINLPTICFFININITLHTTLMGNYCTNNNTIQLQLISTGYILFNLHNC